MHLSLPQQCSFWTLLLLLVSMVQGENKTSSVDVKVWNISYHSPTGNMLNWAIKSSQDMNHLISELSTYVNKFYAQGRGFNKRIIRCHTSSLSRPKNKEQTQNIESEVLLTLAHTLLQAWVDGLHHLWAEMADKLGCTPPILTKALAIRTINKNLLESMKKIACKAKFALGRNVNAPLWSELERLQSPFRDTRYFAFYNLFRCLGSDSNDVEMYLKVLKCRMLKSGC
ncbi:prolactin-4A1-like [Chionomys nivalis]|uniref:prolactin-4A1-like n=1 Tax=Chionomys nivalis TaxID=269649 RepID=UPI0025918BC7|nr:prolactin-4A1-like [Chionomys nivalis]